jgi:UPF0755 protein
VKKRYLIPLSAGIVLVIAIVSGLVWWKQNSKPPSGDKTPVRFVVQRGKSADQIAKGLYAQGLIKSPLAFKIYVQITGNSQRINFGEFKLNPSLTLKQIVEALQGSPAELWVTIPEGLRREEIVEKFIKGLEIEELQASTFRSEFLLNSQDLEGFLFPDTYLFPRDASASAVVKKLKSTFDAKLTPQLKEEISKSGYTLQEMVTLASLLERETKTVEERPIVAGIILNRLKAGWPLQIDATVQYAVASQKSKVKSQNLEWWPILTKENLEINSPYNSYKFRGLPPTPIANPGFASIKAAIEPQDSPYWFYLHDSDGKIHYAENIQEHNQNIKIFLGK